MPEAIAIGDVMQISPDHGGPFAGALLFVEEIKGWGVQGFVQLPQGRAYVRLGYEEVRRVGPAPWPPEAL